MSRKATLVFIYNSYRDPLFQNLVLSYIKTLSTEGPYTFHLITYEQDRYAVSATEKVRIQEELQTYSIKWYPQRFHTGRFLILKKFYDLMVSLLTVAQIRIRYHTRLVFAFANVSGAFSIILSKLFRMKFLIYSYEPHAEFQAELGLWKKNSLPYKILSSLEKHVGLHGNYILTGTEYMVEDLRKAGAKGKVFRAPTSVDTDRFAFDQSARDRIRGELGVGDRPVLLYLGKFGGLYYKEETALFCKYLQEHIKSLYFLIVTPNDNIEVQHWFYQAGLLDKDFSIVGPFTNVIPYISAADLGLNAIPPLPAQKYRSPTKVAEYLACGIPYITCRGISEDDVIALKYRVGVVFESFSENHTRSDIKGIHDLLNENKDVQRARCRKVGIAYRGKANVDRILSQIYQEVF